MQIMNYEDVSYFKNTQELEGSQTGAMGDTIKNHKDIECTVVECDMGAGLMF